MDLGDVLETMVEMLVVEFEGAHGLDLLLAVLVDAQGYYLLLVLHTSVLLALTHRHPIKYYP